MKLKRFIASIVATALVGTTMAITSTTLSADAIADTYTASLQGQLVDAGFWNADAPSCSVNGDGNYSISYTYTGEDGETTYDSTCLILKLDFNVYSISSSGSLAETGIVIDINSVDVDGTDLGYSGSSSNESAYRVDDDGSTIRHNIYNVWSSGQNTQDITVPFTVTNGSVVTVNFTVSGLDNAIHEAKVLAGEIYEEETSAPEETTKADDTTTKSDDTTTKSDGTTKAGETTKSDGSSTEVAQEETTTATGDAGIAGIVLVCALTGAGVVATRKKD